MNHPKNFFLQVGIIATLYASIISFLTFIFGLIDNLLPRAGAYYYDYSNSGVRYAISVLIVMFPLFIWLSRIYRKAVAQNSELQDSKLRKWLLYFTLFLAGLAIAIDIIVLINTFLSGENFALPFILKVLAVLLVAGGVFYFYLKDIKGAWDANPKGAKTSAVIVSVVVLASVIGGIILIGSPSKQRDFTNDNQRVMDLENTQSQIIYFYQDKGVLPKTIEETADPLLGGVLMRDPETAEVYKYEVIAPLKFKICATFKTDSKAMTQKAPMVDYPMFYGNQNFEHGIGETCFERTIDKDRLPVIKVSQ